MHDQIQTKEIQMSTALFIVVTGIDAESQIALLGSIAVLQARRFPTPLFLCVSAHSMWVPFVGIALIFQKSTGNGPRYVQIPLIRTSKPLM